MNEWTILNRFTTPLKRGYYEIIVIGRPEPVISFFYEHSFTFGAAPMDKIIAWREK